jgi:hypothetical protein
MLQNDNIGRLATFSMRSLRRTYQNGIRQMPPSEEEVIAVTVPDLPPSCSLSLSLCSQSELQPKIYVWGGW